MTLKFWSVINLKHNIRINGVVKEIDCELGSGILDKNGKEIFEGDFVLVKSLDEYLRCRVGFKHGMFPLRRYISGWFNGWASIGGAHACNNTLLEIVDD